jgi:hypothetical protein
MLGDLQAVSFVKLVCEFALRAATSPANRFQFVADFSIKVG